MWPPTGLIPWFSKIEGKTYATLLHHPFLCKGKPTWCSRGSKKDFWRRCRGDSCQVKSGFDSQQRVISGVVAKSKHTKYPSQTLIPRITLFAICLSFSSPPLHLCRFIGPLFRSSLFTCFLCACLPLWPCLKTLILTLEGWKKLKTTLEVLCPCILSIIISSARSLNNKKVL